MLMDRREAAMAYKELKIFFDLIIHTSKIPFPTYCEINRLYNKNVADMILKDVLDIEMRNRTYLKELKNCWLDSDNITFQELRQHARGKSLKLQILLDELVELAIAIYFANPSTLKELDLLKDFGADYYNKEYDDDLKWMQKNLKIPIL